MTWLLLGGGWFAIFMITLVVRTWLRFMREVNQEWTEYQRQLADRAG